MGQFYSIFSVFALSDPPPVYFTTFSVSEQLYFMIVFCSIKQKNQGTMKMGRKKEVANYEMDRLYLSDTWNCRRNQLAVTHHLCFSRTGRSVSFKSLRTYQPVYGRDCLNQNQMPNPYKKDLPSQKAGLFCMYYITRKSQLLFLHIPAALPRP